MKPWHLLSAMALTGLACGANGSSAADAVPADGPAADTADSAPPDGPLADAGTPADARRDSASEPTGPAADALADRMADTITAEVAASTRRFPDTSAAIGIFADQLPAMSQAQLAFAASHYVGTQKLVLGTTQALRALNPGFLVLHYHLAMWQSAPATSFIVDGLNWSNDYPEVTTHESWFWHNVSGARVPSSADGKLLMNVSDPGFAAYWADSIAAQTSAGGYDGVFLDSASPALLQGECGSGDPRLAGTAARTQTFSELGGQTWIAAWQTWISGLDGTLAAKGIPLIPNTSAFVTTWDNTDYTRTAGIFVEGFADPSFSLTDWKASTNQIMAIAAAGKIVILQNYLGGAADVQRRLYYLANYLLVKGSRTYLFYFASSPLEWYPEWTLGLGQPVAAPTTVDALAWQAIYRRDFAGGVVLLNPSATAVSITLEAPMQQATPQGGGAVAADGTTSGALSNAAVTSLALPANSGAVLLR